MNCARAIDLLLLFASLLLLTGMTSAASSPWDHPVVRSTNDRDADLVTALVNVGRFDDALDLCRDRLSASGRDSDDAAKWSIRWSQVLSARLLRSNRFDDSDIESARQPVADLIKAYPSHRRRLFLDVQRVAVLRDAALHGVLRAAVSPADDSARDAAVRRLLRATTEIESLFESVSDQRGKLDSASRDRDFALASDLVRLQQQLQVDAVSLDLMQTELFARGSEDRIAAATKAEQSAVDAITTLPLDTAARREVERLRVESIIRSQQLRRADSAMDQLVQGLAQPLAPRIQAMRVRLDVAAGRMTQAEQRLKEFYGDSPQDAPSSIAMDLARLEFLLRGNRAEPVGNWLEMIEERGGGYARRRAEALSLAFVLSDDGPGSRSRIDPSIVAAQGQDWLRRGDPSRAGDLLAAAAAAERDPDRAVQRASEAAAVLLSADRQNDAIEILSQTTLANHRGDNAAAANLQAAYLASSLDQPDISSRLEKMLKANLKQWPSGPTAAVARQWLAKILTSQDRHLESAEVVSSLSMTEITPDTLAAMLAHWKTAVRKSDQESRSYVSQRLQAAFTPLIENDAAFSSYRLAAALWMEREALRSLPNFGDPSPTAAFANALIEFRESAKITDPLRSPPTQWVDDAIWRLMQDGRTETPMRTSIAELLSLWTDPSELSLDRAERLIWSGKSNQAIAVIRKLIRAAPDSASTTRQSATLLGSSRDRESQKVAVTLWDELAAGTKQGSRLWHEAKLAAIKLLQKIGEEEQARRRAKYILLTVPSIGEEFKWQYEAAAL